MATANMFTGASNVAISGGTFINQTNSGKSGFERLSAAAAHSALHDAPARTDGTRCLQDTRSKVLDRLERWAQGMLDEETSIFWLHGGAGAGKSAVMQTLAERFAAQGLALGSFFFSRDDKTRNTAEVLIPTLVYQLAQLFPSALEVLNPIIDRDPLIFNKNFQVQLLDLFVRPLEHLVHLGIIGNTSQSPRVFLIDGLDECSDPTQHRAIIQAAAAVCHKHSIPVKFLISSRLEPTISMTFQVYKEEKYLLSDISLSEEPDAYSDIRQFIEAEFSKIRSHHPFKKMIPVGWPDLLDVDTLARKSSDHFIYAFTAMKYFWSARDNPVHSLQVLLGLEVSRTTSPFAELDSLYHHILASAAHRDSVLQLLAYCIYAALPPSLPMASFMLDYSMDNLHIYLTEITPLVALTSYTRVKLLHASLGDFLRDSSRSGLLFVDKEAHLASKLSRYFQLMAIHTRERFSDLDTSHRLLFFDGGYDTIQWEVKQTIAQAGSLVAIQKVLSQYSLLKYLDWLLSVFQDLSVTDVLGDFLDFFLVVHSIKTSKGVTLFRSWTADFLNILDTHISLRKKPIGSIFRLLFGGCPAYSLHQLFAICSVEAPPETSEHRFLLLCRTRGMDADSIFGKLSTEQITSIRRDLDTSSECLLVAAAEVVFRHLFDDSVEQVRANVLAEHTVGLLLWLLPKVAVSEEIALYLKKAMVLRDRFQKYCSYIVNYFDQYNTRVLDWRINHGDVDALIEKSRMYLLNDQD